MSKISEDMTLDPARQEKRMTLGTWDIIAVVGYFILILGVGMLVCTISLSN